MQLRAHFIAPQVEIDGSRTHFSYFTGKEEPYVIARATGENLRFVTLLLPLAKDQPRPTLVSPPAGLKGDALILEDPSGRIYAVAQDAPEPLNFSDLWLANARIAMVKLDSAGKLSHGTVVDGTLLEVGSTTVRLSKLMDFTYATEGELLTLVIKPSEERKESVVSVALGGFAPTQTYELKLPGSELKFVESNGQGRIDFEFTACHDVFGDGKPDPRITLRRKP